MPPSSEQAPKPCAQRVERQQLHVGAPRLGREEQQAGAEQGEHRQQEPRRLLGEHAERIGARCAQHADKEGTPVSDVQQRKATGQQHRRCRQPDAERAAVVPPQPGRDRERQGHQAVLDETAEERQRCGRDHRYGAAAAAQEDQQRRRHRHVREPLRIVRADVSRGVHDDVGEEQQRPECRGARSAAQSPDDQPDHARDRQQADQRDRAPDHDMVANDRARPADQIERQRRIVVGNQVAGRRIQRLPPDGAQRLEGVPALVVPEWDRQRQADRRRRQQRAGDQGEQAQSDEIAMLADGGATRRTKTGGAGRRGGDVRAPVGAQGCRRQVRVELTA